MIKCVAVEDEPQALAKITGFIQEAPFLALQAKFDKSLDALNYLSGHTTDLVFLDIQMDKLNGIQLLESLPHPPPVIITSAYQRYAVKSYELKVLDYLLKPYSFDRFLQAAGKARELLLNSPEKSSPVESPKIIFVRTAYQIDRVILSEILYIEGMKDYLGIVINEKRLMCLQNFSSILAVLPEQDFIRVHKSFIVSLDKIESISNHRIRIGEKLIPISETYQRSFYSALEKFRRIL